MLKIYHNPKYRKSGAGLGYIPCIGSVLRMVDYTTNPCMVEGINILLKKLGMKPLEWVRV